VYNVMRICYVFGTGYGRVEVSNKLSAKERARVATTKCRIVEILGIVGCDVGSVVEVALCWLRIPWVRPETRSLPGVELMASALSFLPMRQLTSNTEVNLSMPTCPSASAIFLRICSFGHPIRASGFSQVTSII